MNKIEVLSLKETLLGEYLFSEYIKEGFVRDLQLLQIRLGEINQDIEGPKLTIDELFDLINYEKDVIDLNFYLRNNILQDEYQKVLNKNIKKDKFKTENEMIYISTHYSGIESCPCVIL